MYQAILIADDLTGALDAAAPFAKRGLATRVVCRFENNTDALDTPCDVLSINTESRHIDSDRAAATVARACQIFAVPPPALLIKKIDSTLRGNVASELLAVLAASGRRRAIVTPAMPAQGRTVRGGEVYVHGVPLRDTPFVHDAISPASTLPLAAQLRAIQADLRVTANPTPNGNNWTVWIADCADNDDLAEIAEQALGQAENFLLAGSAGLAEALAARAFGPPRTAPQAAAEKGLILYAVGSRAPTSVRQAERLVCHPACLSIAAPRGTVDEIALWRALADRPHTECLLVQIPGEPAGRSAQAVAEAFGTAIVRLVERLSIAVLLVTGGDTAAAVLKALGQSVITLTGELQAGIALSHIDRGRRRLHLVSKAGGFGTEDLFLRLPQLLGRDPYPP